MSQNQPFNPDEFAKWLVEGVKETLQYRLKQTFNRDQLIELVKSRIPTRGQLFHKAMKKAFEKNGFSFEVLKQGDASFHVIRKRTKKEHAPGAPEKRLVMIPGFGDTPTSWITSFAFAQKKLDDDFHEIVVIDFPGYMGFLSHTAMVPSMDVLINVAQMVCETYPPTVLVGHSLGGCLAGKVAQSLRRPLEHLILIAPSGLIPDAEKQLFCDFIIGMQQTPFDEMIKLLVHQPYRSYQLLKREFDQFYSRPEVKEFVQSVKLHHFIEPSKPFATKKLSVIWGENDRFVPAQWMRYWVECYGPYLNGYMIPSVGHLPQIEAPKTTADLLMAVIRNEKTMDRRWKKIISSDQSFEVSPQEQTNSTRLLA